jgi:lipoprotein-releasing system permease protein
MASLPEYKAISPLRSLWPQPHERLIAHRYLFRYRQSSALRVMALLSVTFTLAVEAYFFLWPGGKTFTSGMVALVAPLLSIMALLLNALSVFSTVAVVGVVLGVAALNVVMAVTSGFQGEIRNRVIGLNGHLFLLKYGIDFGEYEDTIKKLSTQPEVLASSPFVYNDMLMAKEGFRTAGVLVKGVDIKRAQNVMSSQKWLLPGPDGKSPDFQTLAVEQAPTGGGPPLPGMFIGHELQHKLKLQLGDRVRLISPLLGLEDQPVPVPTEGELGAPPGGGEPASSSEAPPRVQEFRVAGIFSSGFDEYDRRLVLVTLQRGQELVGLGDVVNGIEMRVRHVDRARITGEELVKFLGGPPFRSVDWEELNHNLFTALSLQKAVLTLVLFLIVLVAAFNIVASLTMMVVEKTREVAILKAMGMSTPSVAGVFRIAGMWIGFLGTVLGISMGMLTCSLISRLGYLLDAKVYMIDRLPAEVSPREVVLTAAMTLLICLLATLYPALRAAFLRPVDGLRDD